MLWASHHCTLGAGVGATGPGAGVAAPGWTRLSRLGLHFLSALGHTETSRFCPGGVVSGELAGLTGVVGHGRPGHVHDVEGDDGGLEETGAGLGLLEGSQRGARHGSSRDTATGSDVTLTCTLGSTAMTDAAMQNIRLRLMKTLCSVQSSGWV